MRLPTPSRRAVLGLNLVLLLPGLTLLAPLRSAIRGGLPARAAPSLHLHWVRHELPQDPTWPDQPRFTSDAAFRPVVAGGVVLITSSRHDSVTAVDIHTGRVRWRFNADAPVRFAPAAWEGFVYFTSDDGHLYCLDDDGELRWKFRGGPSDRWVLGNERLISTWPARGGPVVAAEADGEGTVYFAAGIWPFMGVFIHALDARTGSVRWQNSGEGSSYIKQPHQTDAFAGIAPQGSLVVHGDRLLVPGGRSTPACFDRHTGKRLHYRLADGSKLGGGPDVVAGADIYVNGGGAFSLANGDFLGSVTEPCAFDGAMLHTVVGATCQAFDVRARRVVPKEKDKAKAKLAAKISGAWLGEAVGSATVPRTTALLVAHGRLYGGGDGVVYAVDLPVRHGRSPVVWRGVIDGTAAHLTASDDHLFVSTRDGRLYAFGPEEQKPRWVPVRRAALPPAELPQVDLAHQVMAEGGREGYAVVWGVGTGGLITELYRQTQLRLIVLDPDEKRVSEFREQLLAARVDGKRISVRQATPATAGLPPYLASLVVSEDLTAAGVTPDGNFFDSVFNALRPYGGVACLPLPPAEREGLRQWAAGKPGEGQARVVEKAGLALIRRDGPLPGAADWTHEHADAANTRVSADARIKAPLGLLWFGGPGNQGILPRHGHGPVPQVCEGRLFIEGPNKLRAIDVYTGRLVWEKELPGLGKAYDNLAHQPGANGAGSNYVSTPSGVYVAHRDRCLRLDPATGRTLGEYRLPPLPREKKAPEWTFLSVAGEYLVGGSGGVAPPPAKSSSKKAAAQPVSYLASRRLTVLDSATGAVRWSALAADGFRHHGICAGNGRLFAIDRPQAPLGKLTGPKPAGRVMAYDLSTGKELWRHTRDVFGTWLSYSVKHDVLVEAGLMSRDTLADEPAGMRAYRGGGGVLWEKKEYFGPALIHGDRILKGGDARAGSGTACEVLTGKPVQTPDPLTGQPMEWRWVRNYGCNTPAASEHLVLFRSGAAGFYDLCHQGGTGNIGGFRSSCTLNLIPAGGVLTAPDYTRTCTCSYQNQTSLGLIHMPEAEMWTFTTSRSVSGPIRRLGVNLGAPGSRKADNGTLWLEYPAAGGPSPKLAVTSTPARPETFRMHQSAVSGDGLRWVGASGVRGLTSLSIPLQTDSRSPRRYTVRLVFLEPDDLAPGQRLFDVALQGKPVLRRFDVCQKAGGSRRAVVQEFTGVVVPRDLIVTLTPCTEAAVPAAVLSGVEVVQEDG